VGAMLGVGDVWAGGYEGRGETPFVLGGGTRNVHEGDARYQ